MAKKSKKQRARLRKQASSSAAERLDVAPVAVAPISVAPVSGILARAVPIAPLDPPPALPVLELVREDHRVSPRVSLAVDIHLASHSQFFSGLSGDISEGGVFLSTYRSLPIGTAVDLEFSLPGSERTVRARGEVKWLREHSTFEPRGVGIAFEELSPEDRQRIHEFCRVRPALYYDDLG